MSQDLIGGNQMATTEKGYGKNGLRRFMTRIQR